MEMDEWAKRMVCGDPEAEAIAPAMYEQVRAGLTVNGGELTDELIERLAAEAEQGYDVDKLRPRRGRP